MPFSHLHRLFVSFIFALFLFPDNVTAQTMASFSSCTTRYGKLYAPDGHEVVLDSVCDYLGENFGGEYLHHHQNYVNARRSAIGCAVLAGVGATTLVGLFHVDRHDGEADDPAMGILGSLLISSAMAESLCAVSCLGWHALTLPKMSSTVKKANFYAHPEQYIDESCPLYGISCDVDQLWRYYHAGQTVAKAKKVQTISGIAVGCGAAVACVGWKPSMASGRSAWDWITENALRVTLLGSATFLGATATRWIASENMNNWKKESTSQLLWGLTPNGLTLALSF